MNELVPQSETAVATRNGGLAALMEKGRPETAKALAAAIQACHTVEKSSRNDYHKYQYASADTIIEEGRKALTGAGLALIPLEASLNGSEREGADRFELVRTFLLIHSSGEMTPMRVTWPVVPDKGRPLDKATAAADTSSLSYLLRDLLMMARVDPTDDMNTRDDRQAQAPPPAKKKRELPADGAELMMRLQKREQTLVAAHRCQAGELIAHVHGQGAALDYPAEIARWGADDIRQAVDWVRTFESLHPAPAPGQAVSGSAPPPTKITPEQAQELLDLARRKGRAWPFVAQTFALPRGTMPTAISPDMFSQIVKALGDEPDKEPHK